MTAFLPDNLLKLFAARPPIEFLPPVGDLLVDKKRAPLQGIADFVGEFEEPEETPPKPILETREEKRARRRKEKEELLAYKIEQGIAMWNPAENPNATEDPYRTLFVARINYETSESKLKREFEAYGKISKLSMVYDRTGKPRGYAFIEYSHKSEMSNAYKKGDGTKIDGRRVVVDYERGRTQKSWLPRRLGGGKGDTRRARESRAELVARGEYVPERREGSTDQLPNNNKPDSRDSRDRDRGGSDRDRGERNGDRNGTDRRRDRSRSRDRGRDAGRDSGRDAGRDSGRDRGSYDRNGSSRGGGGGYGGGRERDAGYDRDRRR